MFFNHELALLLSYHSILSSFFLGNVADIDKLHSKVWTFLFGCCCCFHELAWLLSHPTILLPFFFFAEFSLTRFVFKVVDFFLGKSFLLTGKSFLLTGGLCCLRSIGLVFLLTVEFGFGLFCLRWKSVWSFCLRFAPVRKSDLVFFAYGSLWPEIGFGLFGLWFPHRK